MQRGRWACGGCKALVPEAHIFLFVRFRVSGGQVQVPVTESVRKPFGAPDAICWRQAGSQVVAAGIPAVQMVVQLLRLGMCPGQQGLNSPLCSMVVREAISRGGPPTRALFHVSSDTPRTHARVPTASASQVSPL